jgi:hypothetical protein
MTKNQLIDLVIEQIIKDVEFGDYTAITELLNSTPSDVLLDYLPEEVAYDKR